MALGTPAGPRAPRQTCRLASWALLNTDLRRTQLAECVGSNLFFSACPKAAPLCKRPQRHGQETGARSDLRGEKDPDFLQFSESATELCRPPCGCWQATCPRFAMGIFLCFQERPAVPRPWAGSQWVRAPSPRASRLCWHGSPRLSQRNPQRHDFCRPSVVPPPSRQRAADTEPLWDRVGCRM